MRAEGACRRDFAKALRTRPSMVAPAWEATARRTRRAGRPVLLLDEPFASLDAITRAEMQSWLAGVLGPDRHTVLLVTHDVEEALYLADRVLVLGSRPASVADRIEIEGPRATDRAAAVTSPAFAGLKERALRSLAGKAR